MKAGLVWLVLILAAALEAGGDALVRAGLFGAGAWQRVMLLALGGLTLLAYGCVVNAPRWDFGRLLGVYVVFFFVVAQLISWLGFHQPPSRAVMAGGALIVAGGLVISFWK